MSRKTDLEGHIRASYHLIREYEAIIQTSLDPKEKARSQRAVEEQWSLIKGYVDEYMSLCQQLKVKIASDLVEIVAHFPECTDLTSQLQPGAPPKAAGPDTVTQTSGRQRLSQRRDELQSRSSVEKPAEIPPPEGGFRYDAFISYSSKDRDWVCHTLLPYLESEGLGVCIDYRDFEIGAPSLDNIESAVDHSRKTLLVLTPNWIASEWTAFEAILIQTKDPAGRGRRILPLMVKACQLPDRLQVFTYLDLTNPAEFDFQIGRLVAAIRSTPSPHHPLGAAQGQAGAGQGGRLDVLNPFVPLSGRIRDPDRVFEREREIVHVLEFLQAGSSVALIGPEGVGKSSLLTKLCALAPDHLGPAWEMAYLDFQVVSDEGQFYDALCSALGVSTCRGYALARALEGRQVLLCLDEVEKMTWEGFTRGLRAELRGLAEGNDAPLKLVLAARTSLDHLFPDSEGMTSPLANICLQVDVGPWNDETARAFLADRLEGTGVTFPPDLRARLVEESGGHPARLAQAAFNHYAQLVGGAG